MKNIMLYKIHGIAALSAFLLAATLLNAQPFKVSGVSDLVQVFEDGYRLPEVYDTIKVFGLRGEVLSAQCLVSAKSNLMDVTAEINPFRNQVAGNTLPAGAVEWNFVGCIPMKSNANNQKPEDVIRKAPASFPDYLMAEKQVNVAKGTHKAIWRTIDIPVNAIPGIYAGRLTVKSRQGEQSLPVQLTVYPLTIPTERHLAVTEWDNRSKFEQYHGISKKYSPEWFAMIKKYADNMVAHRQNVFQVALNTISYRKPDNGDYEFDFSLFDRIADVFWSTGKMDILELGLSDNRGELTTWGSKEGWGGTEIIIMDVRLTNQRTGELVALPGKEIIPQLLPALENHLRRKGWLEKSLLHVKDEPSLHNAPAWKEASAYIRQYAPDLKQMDAAETSFLDKDIDVTVPKLDHFGAWLEHFRKDAREYGTEVWFYTVGIFQASSFPNKTIDMPVMDSRILHWLNYRYDAPGYLHWGWNQWTGDPYTDPGRHLGDAWHVYPVRDGVLNSIRWEQMRNGIQDYECFWMLENNIKALKDSLGSGFYWIDPKQRGKEISSKVVMGLSIHMDDPRVLYSARMEVIKELLDFSSSPGTYVQTNPPANSVIENGNMVEVFGWAEPGARILVNGQQVKLRNQGLFLESTSLSVKRNTIRVEVSNTNGTKLILREFVVK